MKLRTNLRYVWLTLAFWLCAGYLLKAGEYENLMGRHVTRRRGQTKSRLTVDMLILGRTGVDSVPLLLQDIVEIPPGSGNLLVVESLNATELDLDAALSGRYDLVLTDSTPWELQFTITGMPGAFDSNAHRSADDITAYFFGTLDDPGPFDDADVPLDRYNVVYRSWIGSGEVNLRRRLGPNVILLSGFRFIGLQEDLEFIEHVEVDGNTTTRTGHFIAVDNSLFGYQIGAESTVWSRGRAKFVVEGRGGVFVNQMELKFHLTTTFTDPLIDDIESDLDVAADKAVFAGDFRATLVLPLGGGSLRLGYQFLGLSSAALAPDQLDNFDIGSETGAFDPQRTIYHGGFIGLEIPF